MLVGLLPPGCVITLGHESSKLATNQATDRPTEKHSGTWVKHCHIAFIAGQLLSQDNVLSVGFLAHINKVLQNISDQDHFYSVSSGSTATLKEP